MNLFNKYIPQTVTAKQRIDTGMAATLIFLLLGFFLKNNIYYTLAIPLIVITMAFPLFFHPFAFFWLGITNILGSVVSKILLILIFCFMVVPVGLIRKLSGKDALKLNQFKKSDSSVFRVRNHTFSGGDLENPY